MERVKERVRKALENEFAGAGILLEDIRPNKFIVTVVWEGFKGTDEPDRQELIWRILKEEFQDPSDDFRELLNYLGFVLTWTEDEKAAYEVG
jgi:stress-induced morphogen